MRRLGARNLAEESPSLLTRLFFHTHPPIDERIDRAVAWARDLGTRAEVPVRTGRKTGHVTAIGATWDEAVSRAITARQSIEHGAVELLGPLMDANHGLLRKLGVSCPELDALVLAARKAGAWGAKLSGGGRGGNMIALVNKEQAQRVCTALQTAGARRTLVTEVKPWKD